MRGDKMSTLLFQIRPVSLIAQLTEQLIEDSIEKLCYFRIQTNAGSETLRHGERLFAQGSFCVGYGNDQISFILLLTI